MHIEIIVITSMLSLSLSLFIEFRRCETGKRMEKDTEFQVVTENSKSYFIRASKNMSKFN